MQQYTYNSIELKQRNLKVTQTKSRRETKKRNFMNIQVTQSQCDFCIGLENQHYMLPYETPFHGMVIKELGGTTLILRAL